MLVLTPFLAFAFALIHIFGSRLQFLDVIPRSRWLSFAGGVSTSYVFVHIFPELEKGREALQKLLAIRFVEYHIYLVALIGFSIFYGLENYVVSSRLQNVDQGKDDMPQPFVFWVHLLSFAVYNVLIGYLLSDRAAAGMRNVLVFFGAMALHFFVNDSGLREHYKQRYHSAGRWLLSAAVLMGWLVAQVIRLHEAVLSILFALLAGGVILNVIKEELPENRRSSFWSFFLGACFYAAILILL